MRRGKLTKCLPAADATDLRTRRTLLLLIAPSAVVTVVITLVPMLLLARMSLSRVSRFGRIGDYVGLQNFASLAADPLLPEIALRTVLWTASVVAGTILIALPTALILNQRFFGRGFAQFLVLAPWAISLTSMAVVWRRALTDETGLLNSLAMTVGLLDRPVIWLGPVPASFSFEIMIAVLVSIPFSTVIFLAGLSSIPADIYDAARLAGAGAIDRLKFLTLPLLRPFIWVVLIFNVAYVTNSFPIIWILTQGGPANSTEILVTYLYKLAFTFGRLDQAAALSVVMLCGLAGLTILMLRVLERPDYG
jgi:multiple sugar transport system permease protein